MNTQVTTATKPTTKALPTKTTKTVPVPVITPETTEITPVTTPATAITTTTEHTTHTSPTTAMQTVPTTPITDSIGDIVLFRLAHNGQVLPAVLTHISGAKDRKVDLTVFTRGKLDFPEGAPGWQGVLPIHGAIHGFEAGNWYKPTEKA